MRLDKFLGNLQYGTRKEIKEACKKGYVEVNNLVAKDPSILINPDQDKVMFCNELVFYKERMVLALNKPSGYVSASSDSLHQTVIDLVKDPYSRFSFQIAGRLDIDTTGLVLLTNDGNLLHQIIHPKKEIEKCYDVILKNPITRISEIEQGVWIKDGKDNLFQTLPAKIKVIDQRHVEITIIEGKFHQVKRMFEAVDNEVIHLKRIRIGQFYLPESLELGEYIELSDTQIEQIFQ